MKKQELDLILQEGETHKIEFKEKVSDIDKNIVAFANASGGKILIGVSDNKKISGIKITNKLKSKIQDIANNCDPKININLDSIDNILIVNIPEGTNKPYMCKKGFFMRLGPNTQKLSRGEILRFAIREGKVRYDEEINTRFNFKEDFDEKKFADFLKKANITVNLPYKNILVNMELAKKYGNEVQVKNVVSLFFSKKTRKFNTSAYTTCILFKGNSRSNIIDRKDFEGNLFEQVEDSVRFVKKNIMLTYQIKDLVRKEIPQYPIDAIREGIVNAIMHRDYFEIGSNVFVYIYDDFIEIVNPGGLFGIKKEDLGKICARRNERIADMFKMLGFVEKAGTGIRRMKNSMKKAGLKEPKIEISENFFIITFCGHKREELGEISEGREVIELNERQKKALKYLNKRDHITTKIFSKIAEISERQARYDLKNLVEIGLIYAEGETNRRVYKLRQTSANFGKEKIK